MLEIKALKASLLETRILEASVGGFDIGEVGADDKGVGVRSV